jgi:GNAT superfamily N-acetyltransferase
VSPDELLWVYDVEARGSFADRLPGGWTSEQDGPLARCVMPRGGFAMFTADASGLSRDELVALVDRTFAYYAERGLEFEWKTFDHDRSDLIPLLVERGSVPEPHESLVMGSASTLAEQVRLPDGLTMTSVVDRTELERIAELMSDVWDDDRGWMVDDLERRLRSTEPIEVFVVKDGDLAVSAAWLVPIPGTRIAGLWGGSTRAAYRGRGIYRALVAHRAQLALERGYPILQVDATDDSRPILERLGLHVVGGTTPYVRTAEKARSAR